MCLRYNVKSLHAFGSVCSYKLNELSDIDLKNSFKPMNDADYADSYLKLTEKPEKIFKRPVDLVTDKSFAIEAYFEKQNDKIMLKIALNKKEELGFMDFGTTPEFLISL